MVPKAPGSFHARQRFIHSFIRTSHRERFVSLAAAAVQHVTTYVRNKNLPRKAFFPLLTFCPLNGMIMGQKEKWGRAAHKS